jgi:thiamine-phosphate pyrophosphorylase
VEGLAAVAAAVEIPVVGIGGVTPEGARLIAEGSRAVGTAAISAVMAAPDPGLAARELMAAFGGDSSVSTE